MVTSGLQLSLTDIAELAHVKRPVVSVWRRRASSSDLPFPARVGTVAGGERFDADAIVDWLESTGRGNNSEVRDDAAAYAIPTGISLRDDERLFDGLTALLCLRVVSGEDLAGLSSSELAGLARDADPDDELLMREVTTLGPELPTMASYADRLADAAFSSAEAFERLLVQRFRHAATPAVEMVLAPPVHDLVAALARSLSRDCGAEPPAYVDPTGAGSDLLITVAHTASDEGQTVFTGDDGSAQARLFQRRLRVHDLPRESVPTSIDALGPAVLLVQFPPPGRSDLAPEEILDAIDDIALQMSDDQRAIVLAPASLLIDRMSSHTLHQQRSEVLRLGRVRAMVRLPAGLVIRRSRQALALWVLGPDHERHPLEERRIAAIDVSDQALTDLLIGQIVDDVVAAMAEPQMTRAHSYGHARLLPTSMVLAQSGALFGPRHATSSLAVDAAALAVDIERLRQNSGGPVDALAGARVELGEPRNLGSLTVDDALGRRLLRVLPGNREGFDSVADGNVAVIGVPELTGASSRGSRTIDRLTFLGSYDAARLTEAGDLVFCTSPRPAAVVDESGGSAVQYPARIMRVDPVRGEGLSPHVLAAAINEQPARSRAWRAWPARRVPADQLAVMAQTLSAVEREKAATTARLAELNELHRTVVQGVAGGSIALSPSVTTDEQPTRTERKDR